MIKYYTDEHNVDEDMVTIDGCGGRCDSGSGAGITRRNLDVIPLQASPTVASSTVEMFIYYTDFHEVDEDLKTINLAGGMFTMESFSGITGRQIANTSAEGHDIVAFKNKCEIHYPRNCR